MRWLLLLLSVAVHAVLAEPISGRVITVVDGDTLTVLDGSQQRHRVRLAGIDAPEQGQPFYLQSAQSLARICYRKPATVEADTKDPGDPPLAKVTCGGVDASSEQVRRGMAWTSKGSSPIGSALVEAEAYARLRKIGLWSKSDPVPPWEWRARGPISTKPPAR